MYSENTQRAIDLMKEKINDAALNGFDGRAVLLFSGGRDSSAVAAAFCNAFPQSQLHLLLIDNGLLSRLESTERQACLLADIFPETDIIFSTKRVSQMMRKVGMQQVESDFTKHGFSTLLICLGCKFIMNFSAARYAQEQGIEIVMDGYANRQHKYPEQTEEFMSRVRSFYSEIGLKYLSPLYDFLTDKELVNQVLREMGVYIAKQEPICMWADSFSTAKPEEIIRYTEKALVLIRKYDPSFHC